MLYFWKSGTALRTTAVHCINWEPLSQLTKSFSLANVRCPFTQYMASRPDKFGQKYLLAIDKESKYIINSFSYVERDELHSVNDCVSDRVVMQLMCPYLCKEGNVTTDSYFTSLKLANQLTKQTSLLGTMNKIWREVPLPLRKMKKELHSCKLYKCGDTILTVYQGKVNKHVLILNTMRNELL